MEDRDFFDKLFQLWSSTTGSQDRFWMPEAHFDNSGRWNVYAVGQDESRKLVASGLSDKDSDFITAVHGCFADLWRRLHSALDEADRADHDRDSRECRIAELESEIVEANYINSKLREEYQDLTFDLQQETAAVAQLQSVVNTLSKDPPWHQRG